MLLVAGRMVISGSLSTGAFFVQPAPRDARDASSHAWHVDRPGAARDRSRRADLRDPRRARGDRRPASGQLQAGPGHVAFENVTFGYDPARPVLEDIALDSRRADGRPDRSHGIREDDARRARPALLRRNGRQVLVDGVDVRDLARSLRRRSGHLAGSVSLLRVDRDNMPECRTRRGRSRRRREAAQAHDFILELPRGTTRSSESGESRSREDSASGSRSRGRCSSTRASILDDATASVDATTEARIRDGLREVMKGRRPSSSPTACRRSRSPTRSWCSTEARSPRAGRKPSCSPRARSFARSTSTACCSR